MGVPPRLEARFLRSVPEAEPSLNASEHDPLARTRTRDELYDEAARLGIEGRSTMSNDELATAIRQAR